MEQDFKLMAIKAQVLAAQNEIRDCVPICERYGLTLTENDIHDLVVSRQNALKNTGRIEFAGGILPKLIYAFCDSPFVDKSTWAVSLCELQEAFYYFKGEAHERFSDDELIEFMVKVFNGRANGSAEYLIGTSLEALCRYARTNLDEHSAENVGDLF